MFRKFVIRFRNKLMYITLFFVVIFSCKSLYCNGPSTFFGISDDSITWLYKCSSGGCQFYIPKEKFVDQNFNELKKTLQKYEFKTLGTWSDDDWVNAIARLKKRAEKKDASKLYLDSEKLLTLLNDAKTLLKSFLLEDDNELPSIQQNYIKKTGLNRLFTYAKLQQVIDEKQLNSVRLPRKILVIQNTKTGNYLSSNDAQKIIDDNLKIYVDDDGMAQIDLQGVYEEVIYAQKETDTGAKFSKKVMEELYTLCNEAPFDIGFGNIFQDSQKNAVIIDTEYKKTRKKDCTKLNRYGSLPKSEPKTEQKAEPEVEPKSKPEPTPEPKTEPKEAPPSSYDPLFLLSTNALGLPINILLEEITKYTATDLKKSFEKLNIIPDEPWQQSQWEEALFNLKEDAEETKKEIEKFKKLENQELIIFDYREFPKLLLDTKNLIKSFLLKDTNELPNIEKNYIKQDGINQLFLYAQLKNTLEKEQLKNIELPHQIFVIKNKKTNKYLSFEDAQKIIDQNLKLYSSIDPDDQSVSAFIKLNNKEYEGLFYTKKVPPSQGDGISQATLQDLPTLCLYTDLDFINDIRWDSNGKAIITNVQLRDPEDNYYTNTNDYCDKLVKNYPIAQPKPEQKSKPVATMTTEKLIESLNQLNIELTALNAEIKTQIQTKKTT